jgi:hypothetical protein
VPRPARLLLEPAVGSVRELLGLIVAAQVDPEPPFRAGDAVIVPHALWRAATPAERGEVEYVAQAYGLTLRPGYVDQAVIERPRSEGDA